MLATTRFDSLEESDVDSRCRNSSRNIENCGTSWITLWTGLKHSACGRPIA